MKRSVIGDVAEEFESVYALYRSDERRGIPMSVRERYERALTEIRDRIRKTRQGKPGKRLGELLIEQGALDQEKLQQALDAQRRRGKGELLGEVLTTLGLINEESLLSALRKQLSEN